ncbi:MAG: tRNA-binding protein [Myxococcota bacterium]|jgi:tRNA-binding protein
MSGHDIDTVGLPYAPGEVPAKPDVGIEPFALLDLRVGRIIEAAPFPAARTPAWQLTIDLGPVIGVRRSSAQLTRYTAEQLRDRRVVCAVNLGPRTIAGFTSEVLVLAGLAADGAPHLLGLDEELPAGSVVA